MKLFLTVLFYPFIILWEIITLPLNMEDLELKSHFLATEIDRERNERKEETSGAIWEEYQKLNEKIDEIKEYIDKKISEVYAGIYIEKDELKYEILEDIKNNFKDK
jgi:hypothetical protein